MNIGRLLYHDEVRIIYRPPNGVKPITVHIMERKIVRQWSLDNFAVIDLEKKIIKIVNRDLLSAQLLLHTLKENENNVNKPTICLISSNGSINISINKDRTSLINNYITTKGIPSAIFKPLHLDSNVFLIYHEDKLLFVL